MDCSVRTSIEQKIAETLRLQPTFPKASVELWAKVLSAALTPLVGDENQLFTRHKRTVCEVEGLGTARLQAVVEFSQLLLAKGDEESTPNEFALEAMVNEWNKVHNGGAAELGISAAAGVVE